MPCTADMYVPVVNVACSSVRYLGGVCVVVCVVGTRIARVRA